MKRSGPIRRKVPPDGKWGLSSKPKEGAPQKPRKALRKRSKKMEAKYVERRKLVDKLLRERPDCETCPRIWSAGLKIECGIKAVDVHEILARSAGGSILDEANCVTTCRAGHDWIGNNPTTATKLGLRRSRWNRPNGKDF